MCGFTLAEVLIVLGIIGLIADMTIPTLIQNYREKVIVSRLKSTYSLFSQAFTLAVANGGPIENWGFNGLVSNSVTNPDGTTSPDYTDASNTEASKILFENFASNLKLLKVCEPDDKSCFKTVENGAMNVYSGILANGTAFYLFSRSGSCSSNWGKTPSLKSVCADLLVDLDGPQKGKHQWGVDIFRFFVSKYGVIPVGQPDMNADYFKEQCLKMGSSCTAWVLYNENTDYLHCKDLSWDGKKTCR